MNAEPAGEYYPVGLEPPGQPVAWEPVSGSSYRRYRLSPKIARDLARGLKTRVAGLRALPERRLLASLGQLHQEWSQPESALREEAVRRLVPVTGYPASVLDTSLRQMFAGMGEGELDGWLRAGGVTPEALDGLCGGVRVFGPALTVVVASGNIPGAALPSVVQALLLKSACLVKTASREPALLPFYARSLARHDPDLAAALVVTGWEGGQEELETALLAEAEALIAYGSDAALAALRARLPLRARFIPYGHRISFSAIAREWLTRERAVEAAGLAALDLATFDQQGCLSPQAVYLERGGEVSPEAFGELLAAELEAVARKLPRREVEAAEAAAIHQFRAQVEMRALLDPEVRLWASAGGTRWTVALVPETALEPCCLNRTALLKPLDDLRDLPHHLAEHRPSLISAGIGVGETRLPALAALFGEAGVTRVCRLGRAQQPKSALYHDGVNAIAALTRTVRLDG